MSTSQEKKRQQQARKLKQQKSNYETQKQDYENQKSNLDDNISRLDNVRSYVSQLKDQLQGVPNEISNTPSNFKNEWYGATYLYYNSTNGTLVNWYNGYIGKLDSIYDQLCDEIYRLQCQSNELDGWLGDIKNTLNYLWNEILKYTS